MLDFRILGPLEILDDEGPVPLGGPKQRATLAILLLEANRVVSVDRLADDLYAGAAPVTAVTQVQRQISELRKLLGASTIETRPPGYAIRVAPEQLDLRRFERVLEDATREREREDLAAAVELYREALAFWRGRPLDDLAYEPFAQLAIARLEEVRLAALEERVEAELALGRHVRLVGELEQLVTEYPFRERIRGQLMLALYRSNRQAEALGVYRSARQTLVEAFGIEPAPMLRELERAILTHNPSLELEHVATASSVQPRRAILVSPSDENRLDSLLAVAEPLARHAPHELIVARLLPDADGLVREASALNARRATISGRARMAVFTTDDAVGDLLRLAAIHDVDVVLIDAQLPLTSNALPGDLAATLEQSAADVALVVGPPLDPARGSGVFVPFGGGEHDWAALEFGAWLAAGLGSPLTLVGTAADAGVERRDASRLLADASLAVQRVVGVEAIPCLADATEAALVEAVEPASIVVAGISPRWRRDGIGAARRALVRNARRAALLLVHRGPRPGGLAPHENRTCFSWTIEHD